MRPETECYLDKAKSSSTMAATAGARAFMRAQKPRERAVRRRAVRRRTEHLAAPVGVRVGLIARRAAPCTVRHVLVLLSGVCGVPAAGVRPRHATVHGHRVVKVRGRVYDPFLFVHRVVEIVFDPKPSCACRKIKHLTVVLRSPSLRDFAASCPRLLAPWRLM